MPMTRRQTQKAIYASVVKDGKSHQETFDALKEENYSDLDALANEIVKVPTSGKIAENKSLIYTYIGLMGFILLLKALGVYILLEAVTANPAILIGAVALGILVPALAIYGAITNRHQFYFVTSMLLILGLIRGVTSGGFNNDMETLIILAITIIAITLGFVIPYKLKSKYEKTTKKETTEEKTRTIFVYTFEDTRVGNRDVLDRNF